jgi:putative aldouronate transport system permease protein
MFQDVARVMRNTFAMSLLGIAGSPLSMVFAVFLAEMRFVPVKRAVQTLATIPNFISWVLVYAVAYAIFSVGDGFVNRLMASLGGAQEINFLASRSHVWLTMWLYGIWKGLGWGAVIYIAAMAGIDQELYEAAWADGAGRFASMLHITLPGLLPTYFVLLILNIANFLNTGMEQFYVFQNPMNKSYIEVLDLFVYNQGIASINYSFATAVSILKSLVSLVLLFMANNLSKLFREEPIL